MPHSDILIMTMVTPHQGQAAATVAAVGELFDGASEQPGFMWVDVLVDPNNANSFWLAERWASRDLRDAARLDPAGAKRLQRLETFLDKDNVAAYVPVDLYPHRGSADWSSFGAAARTAGAAPLSPTPAEGAPTVIIARFHLKPGTYDRFIAAERRHNDSLDGTGGDRA